MSHQSREMALLIRALTLNVKTEVQNLEEGVDCFLLACTSWAWGVRTVLSILKSLKQNNMDLRKCAAYNYQAHVWAKGSGILPENLNSWGALCTAWLTFHYSGLCINGNWGFEMSAPYTWNNHCMVTAVSTILHYLDKQLLNAACAASLCET